MLKQIHLFFVALLAISFIGRIALAEIKPAILKRRWLKIIPHLLDTLLLFSGIALIIRGDWLPADYGWMVAKLIALLCFIGLGMIAMRAQGSKRWLAFAGALLCLLYIIMVAIGKRALPFN